jgi:hypothetical protein
MNQTAEQAQILEPKIKVDIMTRPPLPPFTLETSIKKVRLAEDGWNLRDPEKVALAYTIDSLAKSRRVREWTAGDHRAFEAEMVEGIGLPLN